MPKTPAVAYARVSTDAQHKHGYSIEDQRRMIAQYADAHGLRIVETVEDAKTGKTLDRAGLNRVKALADAGRIRAVIIAYVDRLSRRLEYTTAIRSQFAALGVDLHVVSLGGEVGNTPESDLTVNMLGSLAQYELERIKQRSKAGKMGKARSGRWIGAGDAPYGYRRTGYRRDSDLAIVPDEAKIVQRIYREYAAGGIGMLAIANRLNDEHVPPPVSGAWSYGTVNRILHSSVYWGVLTQGESKTPRPDLRIVDDTQVAEVQRRFKTNLDSARRNHVYEYALSNHIYHECGAKMFGTSDTVYSCGSTNQPAAVRECPGLRVNKRTTEAVVWSFISSQINDTKLADNVVALEKKKLKQERNDDDPKILQAEIDKLKGKAAVLLSRFGDDPALADAIESQVRDMTARIEALQERIDAVKNRKQDIDLRAELRRRIVERLVEIRAMLDNADYEVMRTVYDAIELRVTVKTTKNERYAVIESLISSPTTLHLPRGHGGPYPTRPYEAKPKK